MKHKLTKYELLGSLAYPVGIIIWSLYKYISWSVTFGEWSVRFSYQWSYLIAMGVCGVLPIILTFVLRIDTSEQFLPRLVIFLCTIALIAVSREFIDYQTMFTGTLLILLMSLVISAVFFFKIRPVKFSAWIVIFLANPCLVYFITYLMQMKDLNKLINDYNITLF